MTANELARRLKAKRVGRWFVCCCPAHDDSSPSLGFFQGERAVVLRCFTGCDSGEVIQALRRMGAWEANGKGPRHG